MIPTFASRRKAWSNPPIDDIGYLPSRELLTWDTADLIDIIGRMAESRYSGWRNWEMRWRTVLGLDSTRDSDVLDYGCGVGLEALQYAKLGNRVTIADIAVHNIALAKRVLELNNCPAHDVQRIYGTAPYLRGRNFAFDVIHCCGVLHHIPWPEPVVEFMHSLLRTEGELRLMVYSDEAWRLATNTEPPDRVTEHPSFELYWKHWDPIGGFADWYSRERLRNRFGKWFEVATCEPLTEYGQYIGAILIKR